MFPNRLITDHEVRQVIYPLQNESGNGGVQSKRRLPDLSKSTNY